MRVSYDAQEDVLYIVLGNEDDIAESIDVGPESEGISADVDTGGHVVAIEILGARERYGEDRIRTIAVEVPTLA
ncbi:MAG TPA: DUF2283 domain-containing protein [Chloroflexota bacterium]|nr:DUF2283 domain-containing protein [Chloroflexota bacterium]